MEFESLKEIPRQYQLDLYDKAKKSNVIAVLDTGTGKTLISLLVLKHVQSLDSSRFSIFLVPTVPLVSQQANYISINSSLSVFHIYGGMIDTSWTDYIGKFDVFVMTPSMFLTALDQVFDECHHCRLNHPYNLIMSQHYATCLKQKRPKIFGMTASPFGSSDQSRQAIEQLERNLDSIALSSSTNSSLQQYVSKPTERIVYYSEGDFFEPPKLYVKMMEICPKLYILVEKELGDCMALCDMLGPWTAERALEIAIEEISLTIKRRIRELEMKEAEDEFELLRKASDSIEELTIQEIDVAKIDGMLLDSVLKGVAVDEDATMEVDSGEPLPDELVFRKETDEESGEILEDELEEGEILSVQEYIDLKRKGSELMDGLLYKLPKTDGGPLEDFSKDELIDLLKGCDLLQHNPYWGERALPPKEEEIGAKVHCLINVLLEFEAEKEFFCGIVFCQQRLMAHVLKLLIQKHKQLPFIRCEYLLGHGKSAGLYRKSCLTAAAQQEIVRQFRNGEVNLLIATSVAEEGLDIKPCNCVIRFDMLESSLTSYIQSRGRARHRTSQFIIISKQGDDTSEHILQYLRMTESTMRSVLKSKVAEELPEFEPGVKIPPEFQYRIESTGALLTIYNSMEMLLRYCNSLPRDKFFVPTPEYWVAEGPNGFASELRMPQNVRKDCQVLRGALQSSATLAKREVAFRMMKLLHALGEVDDQLRSVHVSLDPNTGKTVRLPSLKPLFMHVQVRKHHVTVPSHFQGRWEANIPLFVNVIRLWNENFNKTLHVGFLTSKKITLATKPFEIFMDTVPFQVEIKSSVESLYFEPRHLDYLKVFHLEFFKSVLRSKLEETLKWATLCVPLIDDIHFEEDLVPAYIIDWEAIEFAGTVDQTDLSIFEKGKAPLEKVSDIVVFDKRRYARSHFILELLPDKNPTNIIEPAMAKKYTSVEHVYRKRLQYSGPMDLDQFVIRAQPIGYPYRCKIRESNLEEAILVPELCIVNPVKSKHLQHARKYPLLLQYIEHRLLMEDLITGAKFPNAEFGFDADINLMQVAFTAPAAQLQYDYERLELFGDSFLKTHLSLHMFVMNPFRHEGFLTQGRAEMENNKNLRKHANKYDMEGFILADTLIRKTYIPPTLDSTPQQEISDKGVADVVEASIAACFLSNGEVSASNCIKFFLGDEMKPNWNSYYLHWCSHTLPQNLLEPSMITSCKLVEKRIGYKFHNVSLLAEALTHASALNGVNSYERLEFLGFIVTQFVFALEPKLSPGKMSELRTELYHNQFLAAVSAKLGLAKFMSHMSVALGKVHENWITAFQQKLKETDEKILTDDASILMFWNEMETAPKTLGDLYEALLGAVFLDSGFKMEPVQKIIKSTLIDVWWPRFEPLMNGSEGLFVQQPPRLITNIVTQNQCSQFIVKTHPQLTGSYLCEYVFHDTIIASVCLETKKESKKMAALEALKYLESNPNCFKEICSCVKVVEEEHEDSDHDDDE